MRRSRVPVARRRGRRPGAGAGAGAGAELREVRGRFGAVRRDLPRVEAHQAGVDAAFGDAVAGPGVGERAAGAARHLERGAGLRAVHPEQRPGFADAAPFAARGGRGRPCPPV
ncbi:hypothetical protein GCM10023100_71140 [Actinocorallia cavernae]|uniref:Uncharacterized protein n=1 Tax=Actinocorallia cavernae TaxID=328075 RepID=A0ABP8T9P6_9ACTN